MNESWKVPALVAPLARNYTRVIPANAGIHEITQSKYDPRIHHSRIIRSLPVNDVPWSSLERLLLNFNTLFLLGGFIQQLGT